MTDYPPGEMPLSVARRKGHETTRARRSQLFVRRSGRPPTRGKPAWRVAWELALEKRPIPEIASAMGVKEATVIRYLQTARTFTLADPDEGLPAATGRIGGNDP